MAHVTLVPTSATMSARMFENPVIGIPLTLFFDIEIRLRAFQYRSATQKTSVALDFIDFRVEDWKDLPGREFIFPVNPEEGYIDGSVCVAHAHHPADVTRIRFGALNGNTLPASLDIAFDFTQEGFRDLGIVRADWNVDLAIDPAELDAVCEDARLMLGPRASRPHLP